MPTDGAAVAVGHDTVELAIRPLEDQRQEIAVTFPERQIEQPLDIDPFQCSFGVVGPRRAVPAVDAEDEAEPIFAVLAETGPTDGAAEDQLIALQPSFLANFSPQSGDHILAAVELATQS